MDAHIERQRQFDQTLSLQRRNDQLVAENARLRQDLARSRQQIARLRYLLRRTL